VYNGILYVGTSDGYVYAMNEMNGKISTQTKVNGPVITTPLGGKYGYENDATFYVYVATMPAQTSYSTSISSLYKIDVTLGTVLWRHPMNSKITQVVTTCVTDICVKDPVFISDNKLITALMQPDLEGETGVATGDEQVLWEYAPEGYGKNYTFNSMSLSNDGTVIFTTFTAGAGSCVHALFTGAGSGVVGDAGSLSWELCFDDYRINEPARRIHGKDDLLFVGYKNEMRAVSAATGKLQWKVQIDDNIDELLVWDDGSILYATTRGAGTKVYGISVENKAELFSFNLKTKVSTFPASGSVGTLYVGSGHYLHEIVDELFAGYENCDGESEEGEACEKAVNEWCLPPPMRKERAASKRAALASMVAGAMACFVVLVAGLALVVSRGVRMHVAKQQLESAGANPAIQPSVPSLANSGRAFEML
jgi:outer membrane protein assembly factor BamB